MIRVGEGIGELYPESPVAGLGLRVEGGDQAESVGELEVALEVVATYLDGLPSRFVEDRLAASKPRRVGLSFTKVSKPFSSMR